MANTSKAIITESEARREIKLPDGGDLALIFDLLVDSSEEIEDELDRKIVTRGTITEFHTFRRASSVLRLHEWPAISVTSVHEDSNRVYGSTTLLVEDTDYIVESSSDAAELIRISGAAETTWGAGFRAIKVIYAGGYTQALAPRKLKRITLELLAMQYRDIAGQTQGLSNVSDGLGSFQRFGPPFVTSEMRRRLSSFKRTEFPGGFTYAGSSTA